MLYLTRTTFLCRSQFIQILKQFLYELDLEEEKKTCSLEFYELLLNLFPFEWNEK